MRILLFIAIILGIGLYVNVTIENNQEMKGLKDEASSNSKENKSLEKESVKTDDNIKKPKEGLSVLIGKDANSLEKEWGKPDRIDPSYYGYDWWVYSRNPNEYKQIGVADGKVVTVFAIGPQTNIAPFKIGQPYEEIYSSMLIETNLSFEYENGSYRFELSDADMNTQPLIPMGDIFAQLYIDKFTGTLSSIRFLDAETLIKQRPYELVYRGDLLEVSPTDISEDEAVENGKEQQILDISNIIRKRHGLKMLKWDEKTARVAYKHSKDMYESDDFSHTSKKYGELSDRLKEGDVFYKLAGENIAANYVDAPAVVEGWLNSKGHRESLLNSQFTHLGVGVYKKHYTQNFIQKWNN